MALRDIIDSIATTSSDQKLVQFAETSAKALTEIAAREKEDQTQLFKYLETINENLFRLTKTMAGSAISLERVSEYFDLFQREEQQKRMEDLEAAREAEAARLKMEGKEELPKESWVENLAKRIGKMFLLLDVLLPALYGFVSNLFGTKGVIATALAGLGAFLVAKFIGFRLLLMGAFKVIGEAFEQMIKVVRRINLRSVLSKAIRRLPVIGAVIAGAIDGIQGAIEGFEEEGVLGGVRGALAGVATGLIGWIGDASTWLVGNLLKMLGFEEIGEQIASFDFSQVVTDSVKGLFDYIVQLIKTPYDVIVTMFDTVKSYFDTVTEGMARIVAGEDMFTVIEDTLKSLIEAVVDGLSRVSHRFLQNLPVGSEMAIDKLNEVRTSVGLERLEGGSQTAAITAAPVADGTAATSQLIQAAQAADSDSLFGQEEAVQDADRIAAARLKLIQAKRNGSAQDVELAQKELDSSIDMARKNGTFEAVGFDESKINLLRSTAPAPAATTEARPVSTNLTQQAEGARREARTATSTPAPVNVSAVNAPSVQNNTSNLSQYQNPTAGSIHGWSAVPLS
jgi:hypothetical protein